MKFKDLKRHALLVNGIYKITNILNNKCYIGSSASKYYLYNRLLNHFNNLRKNKHVNSHLQNAWNKYGEENFIISILETCSPDKCIEREQYYINIFSPDYNICPIANSSYGRTCDENTKRKISNKNKEWYATEEGILFKQKLSKLRKNCSNLKHSDEFKKRLSLLYKNRIVSEETKNKMRKPKISLRKSILDLNDNNIYSSEELSEKYKVSVSYIRSIARQERTSSKIRITYVQ